MNPSRCQSQIADMVFDDVGEFDDDYLPDPFQSNPKRVNERRLRGDKPFPVGLIARGRDSSVLVDKSKVPPSKRPDHRQPFTFHSSNRQMSTYDRDFPTSSSSQKEQIYKESTSTRPRSENRSGNHFRNRAKAPDSSRRQDWAEASGSWMSEHERERGQNHETNAWRNKTRGRGRSGKRREREGEVGGAGYGAHSLDRLRLDEDDSYMDGGRRIHKEKQGSFQDKRETQEPSQFKRRTRPAPQSNDTMGQFGAIGVIPKDSSQGGDASPYVPFTSTSASNRKYISRKESEPRGRRDSQVLDDQTESTEDTIPSPVTRQSRRGSGTGRGAFFGAAENRGRADFQRQGRGVVVSYHNHESERNFGTQNTARNNEEIRDVWREGQRRPYKQGLRGGRFAEQRGKHSSSFKRGPYCQKETFSLRRILDIHDAADMILALTNSLTDFEEMVNSDDLPTGETINILKLFSVVSECPMYRENFEKILQTICNSRLLDFHLASVVIYLQEPDISEESVVEVVQLIICLVNTVCQRRPSYVSKVRLILTILDSQPAITATLKTTKPEVAETMKSALDDCDQCMKMLQSTAMEKQKKNSSRYRRWGVNNDDDDIPPEDFIHLPILPEDKDMFGNEKPFLRANKEEGAFKDAAHYLDVQFRLLREDYIRPLRIGLHQYQQLRAKGEKIGKIDDLRVYYGVRILEPVCKNNALEYRLQCDFSRLKLVRWNTSKRFTFGSLLCLSTDDFETRFFATVTDRNPKDLQEGILQVKFEGCLEDVLDSCAVDVFTLAEATSAFFESYRHVLEGLQEFGCEGQLPFSRYLVDCNRQVKPPAYLLEDPMPKMNLRSLLSSEYRNDAGKLVANTSQKETAVQEERVQEEDGLTKEGEMTDEETTDEEQATDDKKQEMDDTKQETENYNFQLPEAPLVVAGAQCETKVETEAMFASRVSVINPKTWPTADQTILNESQYAAFQTALTKELAVIQGPPGTGKTFVGLQITKILLENRAAWNKPSIYL